MIGREQKIYAQQYYTRFLVLFKCDVWKSWKYDRECSGAVWKSRWPSWAPVPNKPTVSVDVKQHSATTVSAAILCPAVWNSDVTTKAGMFGESIKYVTNQPFFFPLFTGQKSEANTWAQRRSKKKKKKKKAFLLYSNWQRNRMKHAAGNICTFCTF